MRARLSDVVSDVFSDVLAMLVAMLLAMLFWSDVFSDVCFLVEKVCDFPEISEILRNFPRFFRFWCFTRYEPQNEYLLSYRHCWAHGKPRTFVQCLWHNISDGERAKTWKRLLWTCCLSFFWVGWVVTWCTLSCIFLSTLTHSPRRQGFPAPHSAIPKCSMVLWVH